MKSFIKKYPDFCSACLLAVLCVFFLFFGLNFYPILDTQEALFASVSKNLLLQDNYNVLTLNMQPFLEKPPLYFWIITQSIKLMNVCNEISIRLPNTIISSIFVFSTYFLGKQAVSRKFGLTSAIILLTSLSYLLMSHLAILNISFIFFVTIALYFGFIASLKDEKSKSKIFLWWSFYIFCGLACLVKGPLGIILPILVMFFYHIGLKKIKEFLNPICMIPGLILFLSITAPWYYEMFNNFGIKFFQNYFFMPDFKNIFKNLFYYMILFIPAFMPWIIIFFGYLYTTIKKIFIRAKNNAKFNIITIEQKINIFGLIYFCLTLISISTMHKSVYSILLLVPAGSILTSYLLCSKDIDENLRTRIVSISTYLIAIFFTISTISFAFVYMFLPINIFAQVQQFKNFLIIGINFLSILMLLKLKNKNTISILSTYIFSMFFVMVFTVVHGFNMFYLSGENELVRFSQYAKTKDTKLIVYNLPIKPSILMEASEYVYFIDKNKFVDIEQIFKSSQNRVCYLILKNKDVSSAENKLKQNIYVIDKGDKYSIYSNINLPKKAITLTKFYNEK